MTIRNELGFCHFSIVLQCYGFKINQRMAIPVETGCHWLIIFFRLLKLRSIHFSALYTFFFLANILFIQVNYISTAEFVTMFCITFLDVVNGVCKCCKVLLDGLNCVYWYLNLYSKHYARQCDLYQTQGSKRRIVYYSQTWKASDLFQTSCKVKMTYMYNDINLLWDKILTILFKCWQIVY